MLAVGETRESLLASFWQALSHPIRLRVLECLQDSGPLSVGELVERLHVGQGHLSNHLACLKNCGLVETTPKGRYVYYHIADSRISQLLALGSAVLQDHLDGVARCPVVRPGKQEEARNA